MAARTALIALLLAGVAGCGPSASRLTGTVTVNGQSLERGYITFYPAQGPSATRGAEIYIGEYEIKDLKPGRYRVLISGMPSAEVVNRSDGTKTLRLLASVNQVAPQAHGNQQIVEVRAGKQTLDFSLQNPSSSQP